MITRASPTEDEDPVLGQFLNFLARDIANHPEQLQPIRADLAQHILSVVGSTEVDLDSPLLADDE